MTAVDVRVLRLALRSGLLAACALAGCTAQSLTPSRDAGAPPRTVSPSPSSTGVDAGAPRAKADAAAPTAGDAGGAPPRSADAAAGSGPVVKLFPTTLLTSADLSTAKVLAVDWDTIYWVTSDNQLWMLPTGTETPRELAADLNPTNEPNASPALVAKGGNLFWTAWILAPSMTYFQSPLHRTAKAGDDVVLLPNCLVNPSQLAADDQNLYFPAGDVASGARIVALPLDADPGTAPSTLATLGPDLVVSSLEVDERAFYWTTYPVGSTVQVDEGPVFRADRAGLLAGQASPIELVTDWVGALCSAWNDLYFVYAGPGRASGVGRVDVNGARSNLPLPAGNTLIVYGEWALTATTKAGPVGGKLYAVAADAVVGGSSIAVEIADDVSVGPVIGPDGITFVDAGGHLVTIGSNLAPAVTPGHI